MRLRSIDGEVCNEDGNPVCHICGDERTDPYTKDEYMIIWLCDPCFNDKLNDDLWVAYLEEIEPTIEDFEERQNGN